MKKARKKPVEVEVVQWTGDNYEEIEAFAGKDLLGETPLSEGLQVWNTEENQYLTCPVGWWIIRGIEGEIYPCSPRVFEATYEQVESDADN